MAAVWDNRACMPDSLTFTRPDDWHLHVRDGAALSAGAPPRGAQ